MGAGPLRCPASPQEASISASNSARRLAVSCSTICQNVSSAVDGMPCAVIGYADRAVLPSLTTCWPPRPATWTLRGFALSATGIHKVRTPLS